MDRRKFSLQIPIRLILRELVFHVEFLPLAQMRREYVVVIYLYVRQHFYLELLHRFFWNRH